jgi:DNA (cytosine-5)-methyltransferase 1
MYGLDLFSGIGGITKALEGYVRPVAYCENDRYAQAVLMSRMQSCDLPTAPIWDDIRTLKGSMLPAPVEIIYGGFPCQDISVAGRGEGLEGKRSGLFFEIARLVSEIRPRFVFLENVAAITIRGAERVVGELCRLRYDCRWGVLSAADVGANHQRDRWWLLAYSQGAGQLRTEQLENNQGCKRRRESSNDTHSQSEIRVEDVEDTRRPLRQRSEFPETDGMEIKEQNADQFKRSSALADSRLLRSTECEKQAAGVKQHGQEMADTSLPRRKGYRNGSIRGEKKHSESGVPGWWSIEPNVGRVAHGVPFRVDRLKGLGNSVVPAQAREAFERLMGLK